MSGGAQMPGHPLGHEGTGDDVAQVCQMLTATISHCSAFHIPTERQ